MALRNIVGRSFVTHSPSRSGTATNTTYGTGPETYDENFDTYYGIFSDLNADGGVTTIVTDEHTWTVPYDIGRVKAKMRGRAICYGNYEQADLWFDIYLQQSGGWVNIYSVHESETGGKPNLDTTKNVTLTTGWTDVTGIKVIQKSYAYGYEDGSASDAYSYVYETQAFYTIKKSYAGVV